MLKSSVFGALALLSSQVFAYGTGYSTYPLLPEKKLVATEFTGVTSTGGGIGIQGRYTQKISKKTTVDAGLGVSSGERDSRFFAGIDHEFFPDYGRQPKVSLRGSFENAKEFETRRNIISLAPTVSKGFSFWGTEAYPFFSLPFGVNLDSEEKTYSTQLNANVGVSGNLPFEGYNHLIATTELTVGIKDSFTGVFLGLSYPIN